VLIGYTVLNVNSLTADPTGKRDAPDRHGHGLLHRTIHQIAQETDAPERGGGLCTRQEKLYTQM
jgi:hypothetical protein